jgi:hypothetical protein
MGNDAACRDATSGGGECILGVAGAVRELTGDEILGFGWWCEGRIHQLNMGEFRRRARAGAVEDRGRGSIR